MALCFEVEELSQQWEPPFKKDKTVKEYCVKEGEKFDCVSEKDKEALFTVIKATPDRALIQYNRLFTLKNWEQPQNRQVWIENGASVQFSHLWGNNGTTKRVFYRGIGAEGEIKKAETSASAE